MQTNGLVNNSAQSRYEYYIDGQLAAFEDYKINGKVISFNHTEALPGFSGTGAAAKLVDGILTDAKAQGLQVLPYCGYVAGYIAKHADQWLDLVPADRRAEFKLPA